MVDGRCNLNFLAGMGLGKVVMQAFLEYPNLQVCLVNFCELVYIYDNQRVVGVELARSRFLLGHRALQKLSQLHPFSSWRDWQFSFVDGRRAIFSQRFFFLHFILNDSIECFRNVSKDQRALEFRNDDFMNCKDVFAADIVICNNLFVLFSLTSWLNCLLFTRCCTNSQGCNRTLV